MTDVVRVRPAAVLTACALSIATAATLAQELVLHKEGTSLYHRPSCDVVRGGEGVLAMSRGQAEARGLKPHPECDPSRAPQPAADPANPSTGAPVPPRTPQPPVFVFVDSGKQYHREGCKQLGKNPRKLALDEAAKQKWPCPKCKPPIRKRPR